MHYSILLMLNNIIDADCIEKLDEWLYNLSAQEKNHITISRLKKAISLPRETVEQIVERLVSINVFTREFGIRCSECGLLLKQVGQENLLDTIETLDYCYGCDNEIKVTADDIIAIYKFNDNTPPEPKKQTKKNCNDKVAENIEILDEEDSFSALVRSGYNPHSIFYCPSKEEYETMENSYEKMQSSKLRSAEKGKRLEELIQYIFSRCKLFEACGVRTALNQIDCVVRNKVCLPGIPILEYIGGILIIECKNEKTPPKIDYLHKIHDIISEMNNEQGYVRFGIIVSIVPPPKTYREHAYHYYMRNKIIIVSLEQEDLDNIIYRKENILDILDRKAKCLMMNIKEEKQLASLYQ